jgi:2-polyprenyl-3-methyl-5-hydroxy-6-metoxy-1,4-benzoquinol methylase
MRLNFLCRIGDVYDATLDPTRQNETAYIWEEHAMTISPDHFLNELLGYQKTAALKAAIELDLFSALAAGNGDVRQASERTGASERGIRILCDYLTVQGFLEKENGRHRLTPSSQTFLTRASPAYMGGIVDFLASPEMIGLWLADPASFVREGGAEGLANIAPDNPIWVKFAQAMVPFVAPIAATISTEIAAWPIQPKRVLDIAAGHGLFGISLAQAIPTLEVTAIDWPAVLTIACENASAAGVAKRYRTISGSAFDVDWGGGYDVVLLTNFLHHFDRATCINLLSRAHRAVSTGGRVLAVEMVPNDDRVTPPFPAMFAYMMLGSTPSGDAYTASDLEDMGRQAGFSRMLFKTAEPTPETLVWFET